MDRGSFKALLGAVLLAASFGALAQKTTLTVYTALETDQLKAYEAGFNKVHPNIEIKWVRDSTGVITAKLLAEKANPQADVVMGVAASSLALLDSQGMLVPYAPLNLDVNDYVALTGRVQSITGREFVLDTGTRQAPTTTR